jgi:hypothetical protein
MDMEDRIADIILAGKIRQDLYKETARHIMAALPDMIAPLVWRDIAGGWGTTNFYLMPVVKNGTYRLYGIDGPFDGASEYDTKDAAKAAANADHVAAITAAFNQPKEPT